MTEHGWPAIAVVVAWYASTIGIMWLVGLGARRRRWVLPGATLVLAGSLHLAATAPDTVAGAYLGFLAGLGAWAWQEIAFLTGAVTGPRRTGATSGTWRHAWHATLAVLHHEIAIAAGGLALVALCWGQANPVALWTYLALWAMRVSAKLNLFLGVRNLGETMLPHALAHIAPFLRRRSMNPLFPISVTVGAGVAAVVLAEAAGPGMDAAGAVGRTLVGTLLALAVLEHWFMVLPLPAERMFAWGMRSRAPIDAVAVPLREPAGLRRRRMSGGTP